MMVFFFSVYCENIRNEMISYLNFYFFLNLNKYYLSSYISYNSTGVNELCIANPLISHPSSQFIFFNIL